MKVTSHTIAPLQLARDLKQMMLGARWNSNFIDQSINDQNLLNHPLTLFQKNY